LDVVVGKSPSIFELFSGEDETLLVWGNSFLILDFGLDILNRVAWFNLQGDGLACQGFDKDLHTSTKSENQVESGLFLDVVVGKSPSIFELFSGEDETLLVWGNSFLVLDLGLDILN